MKFFILFTLLSTFAQANTLKGDCSFTISVDERNPSTVNADLHKEAITKMEAKGFTYKYRADEAKYNLRQDTWYDLVDASVFDHEPIYFRTILFEGRTPIAQGTVSKGTRNKIKHKTLREISKDVYKYLPSCQRIDE